MAASTGILRYYIYVVIGYALSRTEMTEFLLTIQPFIDTSLMRPPASSLPPPVSQLIMV
jgi:hypothetical protein